jgi:hypothetical protein
MDIHLLASGGLLPIREKDGSPKRVGGELT